MHTSLMATSSLHQPPLLFILLLLLLLLSLSLSFQTHARYLKPTATATATASTTTTTTLLPEAAELPPQTRPSNAGYGFDGHRESSLSSTAAAASRYNYPEYTPSTFATEEYNRERRSKYDGDGASHARYYYYYGVDNGERYVGGGGGNGDDGHGMYGRGGGNDNNNNNIDDEGYGTTNAMDECVKESLASQEENEFVP